METAMAEWLLKDPCGSAFALLVLHLPGSRGDDIGWLAVVGLLAAILASIAASLYNKAVDEGLKPMQARFSTVDIDGGEVECLLSSRP